MKSKIQVLPLWEAVVQDALRNFAELLFQLEVGTLWSRSFCSLQSGTEPNVPSDEWLLTEAPALAREFSVALATDDPDRCVDIMRRAYAIVPHWEPLAHPLELTFKYRRCLWLPGKAPRGVLDAEHACDSDATCRELSLQVASAIVLQIRQVLGLYARLTRTDPSTAKTKEEAALESFKHRVTSQPDINLDRSLFAGIGAAVFKGLSLDDLGTANHDLRFRHGPGAVAERLVPEAKGVVFRTEDPVYDQISWQWFRPLFPEGDETIVGMVEHGRYCYGTTFPGSRSSRVACVPKDFRGPRVIAAEPVLHCYVQHGVDDRIRRHLRRSPLSGAIDLSDQSLNAQAAIEGSITGVRCTLDLSDASDTVRLEHVQALLRFRKDLLGWLELIRTDKVLVGNDEELSLTCFAPMGSPLCFPIESIVFACVILSAVWRDAITSKCSPTPALVREAVRVTRLRVYGDDIVIDKRFARTAVDALTGAGFKVNESKSCCTGYFRESCGTDAWHGYNVTPLRPRLLPGADSPSFDSWVWSMQNFADRGYVATAEVLWRALARYYHAAVPVSPIGVRGRGYLVSERLWYHAHASWYPMANGDIPPTKRDPLEAAGFAKVRWNSDLHRLELRVPVPRKGNPRTPLDQQAGIRDSLGNLAFSGDRLKSFLNPPRSRSITSANKEDPSNVDAQEEIRSDRIDGFTSQWVSFPYRCRPMLLNKQSFGWFHR